MSLLLPPQSQLGAAEDLAQCLALATDYLAPVMKPVGGEWDGRDSYTCTDKEAIKTLLQMHFGCCLFNWNMIIQM